MVSSSNNRMANKGQLLHGRGEGGVCKHILQAVADGNKAARGGSHILADKLTCTGAKDGQRQTGHVLVGAQSDRQETVNQRTDGTAQEGKQNRQNNGNITVSALSGQLFIKNFQRLFKLHHIHVCRFMREAKIRLWEFYL